MKYLISSDQPPPYMNGVHYWERSRDPFGPDALYEAFESVGLSRGMKVVQKPQQTGWLAIEWGENPVGFFADGSIIESDEPADYHFTEIGPSGLRIAERALTSLENARWFQSHGNILVRVGYNSRTVIERAGLVDCLAIIMHEDDVEKFAADFAMVQYPRHELTPPPSINGKPLFIAPAVTEPPNRPALDGPGEFIVVMRRHGQKPKGTISEFD